MHVETDMYFTDVNGDYQYVSKNLGEAHRWCLRTVEGYLSQGLDVVVSNSFTRHWEYEPYVSVANRLKVPYTVLVATGDFQNIHNVPDEVLAKMRSRWEPNHDEHPTHPPIHGIMCEA